MAPSKADNIQHYENCTRVYCECCYCKQYLKDIIIIRNIRNATNMVLDYIQERKISLGTPKNSKYVSSKPDNKVHTV